MAVAFGVATTVTALDGTTTWGYLQGVTITSAAEEAEARDADGDVAANEQYNETDELSAELVYSTTGTAPAMGATIKANSVNWKVTGITYTETNTDYKKCSITAKRWVANTLPTT